MTMNNKSFEAFTEILNYIIKYFKWVVVTSLVLVLLSGIYRVESNEVAVVLRFGRLVGSMPSQQVKQPGLHFAFPYFMDEIIKIPSHTVYENEVITHYGENNGSVPAEIESNGYLLTGDNSVILIKANVKYKIGNAAQYALYSCDVDSAIGGILSGELTRSVTHTDIDSMLTSNKGKLSSEMMINSQKILDELMTGIDIVNVELTEIVPPAETKELFEEVTNASVNKETTIQQAKGVASTIITEAKSTASVYKQDAIAAQNDRLAKVHNEMAEFNGLYDQYTKNPQIIIDGTFRERVNVLLKNMGSSVIVPEGGTVPVIILP